MPSRRRVSDADFHIVLGGFGLGVYDADGPGTKQRRNLWSSNDSSKALVPGAKVLVTSVETGVQRSTMTSAIGGGVISTVSKSGT